MVLRIDGVFFCIMVATFNALEFSSRAFYIYGFGVFEFSISLVTFVLCLGWDSGHLHYDSALSFVFGVRLLFFTPLFISFVTFGGQVR